MSRLFLKLFGTFWLTTVLILAISLFASFRLADNEMAARLVDPRELDSALREVLEADGFDALKLWVMDARNFQPGQTVYIVNDEGAELLGRDVPAYLERRLDRMWSWLERKNRRDRDGRDRNRRDDDHDGRRDGGRNDDRNRYSLPVINAPDGGRWLAMPGPTPPPLFGVLSSGYLHIVLLALAAITSLATFWLLARSLSRPAQAIATAVNQFAAGDLSARVAPRGHSRDEIGEVAKQFDRMAEQLEQQAETQRELFRNILHELRSPLARLQIATDLLERKPSTANAQLARIRSEIDVLDTLTNQVLGLAQASQAERRNQVVPLADVLGRVVENARLEADHKHVELQYEEPAEALAVNGDEALLASAVENVLRNAIQAAPDHGRVRVDAVQQDDQVAVSISDSGPGVPAEELEKIFEPFYRLDTNRDGAGIGLAITARVMQRSGGSAVAANGSDGGLIVTLTLPLARD